ncbi:hypothetical protein BH10PLA2_BH10PLA2_33120 [soil metagenome]
MKSGVNLIVLLWALAGLPADPAPIKQFYLHTADGMVGPGPIERIADDWSISLTGDKPVQVPGKDVVSLRRAGQIQPAWPTDEHVLFSNGDRLLGTVAELRAERLRFQSTLGKSDLTIPLTAVSIIWLGFPDGMSDREVVLRPWQTGRRTRDIVLLRNRDQIEGTLSNLDAQTVRLRGVDRKEIRLERGKVAAIILSNDLSRSLRPRGTYARLVLSNGSRISLASAQTEGVMLVGKTLFNSPVTVPLDQVLALDLYQGRATYLSDLKPKRVDLIPYLDVSWPYQADRSVAGNPLKLVTGVFDKGLGVHSESRLTYDLGGSYQWFEATVGLDEATGRLGSAGIQVLIDGKVQDLGTTDDLTYASPLRYLRLKVAGARELTLVVTFGRQGDVQDHVDWVDARVIK